MDWFDAPNEAALTLALQSSSAFIAVQEAAGGQGANATASPPPFVAPPFIAQVTVAPPPSVAPSAIAPVTWTPGAALMLALQGSTAVVPPQAAAGAQGTIAPASPPPAVAPVTETPPATERINPTNKVLKFIVPVSDGEIYLGDASLAVSPKDELSVEAPRLLQLLEPLLKPAAYQRLAAAAPADGMFDQATLQQAGITLGYDPHTLSLRIVIAVENRLSRDLSLRGPRGAQAVTLQPAGFSAYVNVRAAAEVVEAGGKALVPPLVAVDSAIRTGGFVLETEGVISSRKSDPLFRRAATRLISEEFLRDLRLTVGDTQIVPTRFQASPTTFGFGIGRLYSELDPQREIRASGTQSFSLTSTSVIETLVNGRSVERRTFQPGNYTLADFPLAEGANQVRLRIEDPSGKVREIDFSVYANQSLLAKGITEFSVFGGVYSQPTRTGWHYSDRPIVSGFVRTGLTEQLTVGFNAQADKATQQVGAEGLWGSPLGLTGFSLSASRTEGGRSGVATAATYERVLSSNSGRTQSIRASAEWRSRGFAQPDLGFYREPTKLRTSAGVVMTFGANAFVAADGFYEEQWRLPPATRGERHYGARVTGGLDIGPRLSPTAELGFDRGEGRNDLYLRVGLRLRLGQRGSAQFDADSSGRAHASVSTASGSGNGAWLASADVTRDPNEVGLNAIGSLLTNRAELSVQQSANWDTRDSQMTTSRTAFRAGFALAFADGDFAIGRPVSDAFLIARPHKTLGSKQIYLDPGEEGEVAKSGELGPALDGQLSAHNFRTLIYQVPDAPSGYDLGAGNVSIKPPYRGGYRLVIGSDYHLLVIGRLLDAQGQPVRLLAGKAIDLGDPKHPAITIFTSRDGRFGAQGLRPGRWRFEMPTEPETIYEFEVADSPDGIVRMSDLRPITEKTK